jgi:hypothetical protein
VANFVLLFGALVATAAPAAAIDDPSKPDARVTHGPSCRPGGLVVEVVAGTAPYAVRLATTRTPTGEDEAVLEPGATVILRSEDVAWGETIDGRLEYTARDGSGVTYTDELLEYTFTRPTREDCEAAAAPTGPTSPSPSTAPSTPADASGTATPSTTPQSSTTPDAEDSGAAVPDGGSIPPPVSAGGTVTLAASGFLPGEVVIVQLGDQVLGTAKAGSDGSVQTEVRIPDGTGAGVTTVELMGNQSELITPVQLEVAGSRTPIDAGDDIGDLVPLTAAAAALVATVAGLVSVATRQRTSGRRTPPFRHA